MDSLFEKIASLRMLCEESGFTPDSKEGNMFHGILDVLKEMSQMIENIEGEYLGAFQMRAEDVLKDAEKYFSDVEDTEELPF